MEHPKDLTVHEGQPATFTAILNVTHDALNVVHAQWYFDEEPISSGDIFDIQSKPGGFHSVHLSEAFPEDAGKYSLRVEFTENGEKRSGETEAYLRVEGLCMDFT